MSASQENQLGSPSPHVERGPGGEVFGWIIAALIPLLGILPTFGHGVIATADGPYHVHRIHAMEILLRDGQFWPRWVSYFHLGFGYPVFNFYPPGVSYLGGILAVIGLDAATAFNIVAGLTWIIGSVGMYALARDLMPRPGAILAALLWSYAPSRLHEVWFQGGLAQMMSAAFMPWFFAGLVHAAQHPTRRAVLAIALPLAAIILTHIPMTYITALFGAPAAVVLPVYFHRRERQERRETAPPPSPLPIRDGEGENAGAITASPQESPLQPGANNPAPQPNSPSPGVERGLGGEVIRRYLTIAAGIVLGVGLGAIFLVPMALELQYIQGLNETGETISFLKDRFLTLAEVFDPVHAPDQTDLTPNAPVTLGRVGGLFALVGVIALLRRRRFALAGILAAALGFTIFMLLASSLDVWLTIPYFQQLRFPERLLRAGSIWLALLGGSSLLLLPERWQYRTQWLALWIALPVALSGTLSMTYGTGSFIEMDHLTALDEITFEQRTRIWGTTSYDEYDPIWGEHIPRPATVPEPEEYITDPLRIVVYRNDVNNFYPHLQVEELDTATIKVTLTQDHAIRFHQYYYPGWHTTLDEETVPARAEPRLGLLTIDVPAGEHLITLDYTGTDAQHAGAILSGISVVIVIGLLGAKVVTNRRGDSQPHPSSPAPHDKPPPLLSPPCMGEVRWGLEEIALIAAIVIVTLTNAAIITPHTRWFRQQSPPDQPTAMTTPVHATFGDALELLGYTLHDHHAVPGKKYELTLFWRAAQPVTVPYKAIVQIVNQDITGAWASNEQSFANNASGWTPENFASDARALNVFATAPHETGRIMVQLIDMNTGQPIPLADGSTMLLLPDTVRIQAGSLLDWLR
ncbi:MAG: hypothetical protein JXA10_07815 [Anaerolineae bacterium]|nr:hypothetical protein [Anaerolineae bacterium]